MITYNDIYEALRKEKYSEQLQKLPKNFLKEVAEYFKEKKEILEKNKDILSGDLKVKKQFENAISIFNEIMVRRKKKILDLAFIAIETGISKRDFENMLDFEREMFDKITRIIKETDKNLNEILNGKPKKEKENILVNFKEDVEEFIGLNEETYGPFKKGEIANLPKEIVEILISDGKVEKIEED